MLNGKALISQITQRWKIFTVTKLLRDPLSLTQAKKLKGNFFSSCNLLLGL